VVTQKYIESDTVENWIRKSTKSYQKVSVVWKVVLSAFPLIGRCLARKVGKGNKVRLGEASWVGCGKNDRLPGNLVHALHEKGYFKLYQVAAPNPTLIWRQERKQQA
jgi:hypothetical protein